MEADLAARPGRRSQDDELYGHVARCRDRTHPAESDFGGYGGRLYFPTNEGFMTLQMKPATGWPACARLGKQGPMHHLLASSPKVPVIPTITAFTIGRFFKHEQGQDGGDAELQPKHPAVRFVIGAWDEGDLRDADKHIAPDIEIYTNGLTFSSEHNGQPSHGQGEHRVVARARAGRADGALPGDPR